jgi:hypothetical protein
MYKLHGIQGVDKAPKDPAAQGPHAPREFQTHKILNFAVVLSGLNFLLLEYSGSLIRDLGVT